MWKLDLVELQCYVATDTCIKSSAIWEWCILNYTVSNMSLNIVHLLRNSQAFDMKELLNFSIDSALELHSSLSNSLTLENTQSGVELTACQQQLSEVIQFLQELIRVNPECITPSNLLRFLENVCYTAIHVHQSYLRGQRSGSDDMLQSVYKLFAAILLTPCESGFQELKFRIQQECLEGLRHYIEEQRLLVTLPSEENEKGIQSSVLSMRDISGILDYTFNTAEAWNTDQQHTHVHVHRDDSWLEDCFKYLVDVLEFSEATTCSHVSGILLPKLLNLSQDKLDTNLSIIWDRLLNIHKTSAKVRAGHTCNVYITLCGLSELYIPLVLSSTPDHSSVQHSFTLHVEEAFWRVIQAGLVHTDSLTRKQACFLMKRAIESASANNLKIPDCASPSPVKITHQEQLTEPWSSSLEGAYLFWWSCESQKKLLAMWADFFLMYETLDEVQVHVVTPVMLKMSSLIQAASTPHLDGRPLLHSSWLTVLFSRWFVHETKTISQWGLVEYLGLNITSCPILQEGGTEFFFSSVLPVLNDSSLYVNKTQGDHSRPLVAEAFTQFMQTCVKILTAQQCADFLRELVAAVCRQSWTPVSLTFVVDALTNLPECSAWGPTELQLLREMQFSCVNMLSVSYRRVVQCLMLQAVLRLLDKDRTSLQQLSVLLTVFSKCLCRGSPLWTQVCEWITASRDTQLFGSNGDMVAAVCSEVTTLLTFDPSALSNASIDLSDIGEPSRVACLVLLVVDAKHISRERSSRTNNGSHLHAILAPLVSVLASIGSHIYLPVIKADTALQLLHSILLHLHHPSTSGGSPDTDQVQHEMFTLLFPCLEEIFSFITRRLQSSDIAESADTSRVSLYLSVLESIHTFLERSSVSALMGNVLISGQARLIECCKLLVIQSTEGRESNVLQSHFQSYAACCLLLWLVQMTKSKTLLTLPWDTLLPLVTFGDDIPTPMVIIPDAGATNNLRKMSNLILYTKWKCMSVLLQATLPSPITQPYEAILAACVRDLTLLKGTDAVPLMKSAKVLIYKISQDARSMCVELVEAAWSVILDEWRQKAQKFWLIYAAGVELIFQQCFLVAEEGTEMHDALDKVISSILTLGEGKHKILLIFVKHLCSHWASQFDGKESRILTMKAITNHMSLLVELCTVSSRFSKDIRQQQDTSVFLSQQSHLQTVKDDLIACAEQRPRQRRVVLLNFLLKIATRQSLECCRLITVFLQGLLKKFHELKTSTKPRDMMNSQLHRQNIGLWQMLLVLVPYILKDCAGQILEDVLSSVIREKQSSLKYLMIWVATRLLILVPSLEEHIWNLIQSPRDTSENNVCPLVILVAHLGMAQPDKKHKECFYQRAFPVMLPWALVQTSSIRHLSLLCVKKMWQDCHKEGLENVLGIFPMLRACMCFLQDGNSVVHSQHKPASNFFLFSVHPIHDYTMQTIFHILPVLCSLASDEFLDPKLFDKDSPLLWSNSNKFHPIIRLYNPENSLIQEEYCISLCVQPSAAQAIPGMSVVSSTFESIDKDSNVQKKIIPWQDTLMPGFDDVIGTAGQEKGSRKDSLILVASLIDKAPNLGGLCRTSQIFGVSTLVVGNLRVTTDKIFQTLSVTAEKWLPIIEVPVSDLASYLQAMRHKGYTLVGVEQTARSQCLTKYQFQERTLLLLGHERTGIPVELIQLLDVCVEIPQQGIIRSLNVHVSGALLVWEYRRQRLLAQSTK